jgi:WD40 repeat protein
VVDPARQIDEITGITFTPDDKGILTSDGISNDAKLWDVQTGKVIRAFSGHTNGLTCVAIWRDGKMVATGSFDDTLRLWDSATGHLDQTIKLWAGYTPFNNYPRSVAFSPDGSTVAAGSNTDIEEWDVATGTRLPAYMVIEEKPVTRVTYSPNGQTIAISLDSPNNMAQLLAAQTGRVLLSYVGHTAKVSGVAFSPDGALLVTGSADGTARVWNTATSQIVRILAPTPHNGLSVLSVAFSPDGKTILTANSDHTTRLWSVSSGQILYSVTSQGGDVSRAVFSHDGKFVAIGEGKTVRVLDAATGQPVNAIAAGGA